MDNSNKVTAAFGFGFFLSLCSFVVGSPLSMLPNNFAQSNGLYPYGVQFGFFSVFFMFAAITWFFPSKLSKTPYGITGLLIIIGYLLSRITTFFPSYLDPIALVVGSWCLGAGCGIGFLSWIHIFSSYSLRSFQSIIVAGTILSTIPNLLILFLGDYSSTLFFELFLVLLLISLVFLFFVSKVSENPPMSHTDTIPKDNTEMYSDALRELRIPIMCCAVLALFGPSVEAASLSSQFSVVSKGVASLTGNALGGLVMFILWRMTNFNITIPKLYLTVFPAFIMLCCLFPLVNNDYYFIFPLLSQIFFSMISIAMVTSCIETARDKGVSLTVIYGVFAGIFYATSFVGLLLGSVISALEVPNQLKIAMTIVAMLIIGTCVALIIWKDRSNNINGTEGPQESSVRQENDSRAADSSTDSLEKYSKLAVQFGLSKRETEVLVLLAKGRNVPSISEKLFISQNTVRSHVKRIYWTLDVHSQQELIDLVDSCK